jgi:hypothetical protein
MAQGSWSCASCTCFNPEGPEPVCIACGAAREAGAAVDVRIDERFGEMIGAGRSRPLTPAGRRRVTGSAAAAEARCICCTLHRRVSCCMLSFAAWADGSQRRGCGGALAWTWEVMRRVCVAGCAHAHRQSCSALAPAQMHSQWCHENAWQAREKARRRRVEQLVEAERTCARPNACLPFCLVLAVR